MFLFFLDYQEVVKGFFVFMPLSDIDGIPCLYTQESTGMFWHARKKK